MPEPGLQIYLFGYPTLQLQGREVPLESVKVRALMVYLLHVPDVVQARDFLAYLLWPDMSNELARKNLRQALYSLRKAFGPYAKALLDIQRETITLRRIPQVWVDVWEFNDLIRSLDEHVHRAYGVCLACAPRYERLLALYRHDFLQGFSVRDADPFETWATEQREYYKNKVLHAVHEVTRFYALQGNARQVVHWAQRWLRWDPWSEEAYAYQIRALAWQTRKSEARRVFHAYARMMREDLGMEPSDDMTQLMYDVQRDLVAAPSRSQDASWLPRSATPLVGRTRERHALLDLLSRPDVRLISLLGPGGMGKTRLAEVLAHDARPQFPDGVFWVALEGIQDGDLAKRRLLEQLRFQMGTLDEAQLLPALAAKQALLVLDDVHPDNIALLDWLAQVLEASPDLVVLVTARRPLYLRAEHPFWLSGLPYPTPLDEPLSPQEALAYPAVRLFVERVQRLRADFTLDNRNLDAVLASVRFTQGHPLALELLAAQAAQTSCQAVAQHVRELCLDSASPYRDQPAYHRSVRALLERGWHELPAELQTHLYSLAHFQGPFCTEMAEAIAHVPADALEALAQRSFLQPYRLGSSDAALWELHPLTREFVREKGATQADIHARWQERARQWLLETFARLDFAQDTLTLFCLASLHRETEDLLQYLTQQGDADVIGRVLYGVTSWFRFHGELEQGAAFLERLADYIARTSRFTPEQREALLGRVRSRQGMFALLTGNLTEAHAFYEEALARLRRHGEPDVNLARALQGFAGVVELQGDLARAEQLEREALALYERLLERATDPRAKTEYSIDVANAFNNLGGIAFQRGDLARARTYYERAIAMYREYGARPFLVNSLGNYAQVLLAQGDVAAAQRHAEEALRLAHDAGASRPLANILGVLGNIAIYQDDLNQARVRLRQAVHLASKIPAPDLVVSYESNLGVVFKELQQPQSAERHYRRAIQAAQQHHMQFYLCMAHILYASFLLEQRRWEDARKHLRQALSLAEQFRFTGLFHKALFHTANLCYQRGHKVEALALVQWLKAHGQLEQENLDELRTWERTWMRRMAPQARSQVDPWLARHDPTDWTSLPCFRDERS